MLSRWRWCRAGVVCSGCARRECALWCRTANRGMGSAARVFMSLISIAALRTCKIFSPKVYLSLKLHFIFASWIAKKYFIHTTCLRSRDHICQGSNSRSYTSFATFSNVMIRLAADYLGIPKICGHLTRSSKPAIRQLIADVMGCTRQNRWPRLPQSRRAHAGM